MTGALRNSIFTYIDPIKINYIKAHLSILWQTRAMDLKVCFTYMEKPERHHSLVKMFANKPWLENIGSSTILVRQLSGKKTIFRMYTQQKTVFSPIEWWWIWNVDIYLSDRQNEGNEGRYRFWEFAVSGHVVFS